MDHRQQSLSAKEVNGVGWRPPSVPRTISPQAAPLNTCTSSSFSKSPLWPQTFGRSMDIYSRSPSQRQQSGDRGFEEGSIGLETTPTDHLVAPQNAADTDLREPLLCKSPSVNLEEGEGLASSIEQSSRTRSAGHGAALNGDIILKGYEDNCKDMNPSGSSFFQAFLNGMNVLAGVGILSTPYGLSQGGWLGLGFLLAFAVICCYTAILLRHCLDKDPHISSYPDVGEAAFGARGRWIVSVLLYVELYAVAVEFLILEGDNLAQLFPAARFAVGNLSLTAHEVFVVAAALCMLPTVWLRDLSLLSYISAGGVVASILIVLAVAWVGVFDGVGFHHQGSLINMSGLPVAVGVYAFCFCGHAVFPSIYGSMKDRRQFPKVLVLCFILCTLIYGGIGVMGYLMFGEDLQSQVTLNLPRKAMASHFAIWVTLVNPFAKYALTITPLAVGLEELLPQALAGTHKDIMIWGTILRTILVGSTVAVALLIPFFGFVMAFIGSLLSTLVAIILPCACYLKIFGRQVSRSEQSLIVGILFVGMVVGIIGTYSSLKGILGSF